MIFEIDAGSTSMCTMVACGQNFFGIVGDAIVEARADREYQIG